MGGALQMTEEFGDMAPHWMPYFGVADTDAAAERAAGLGATVGVPPTDSPFGRFDGRSPGRGADGHADARRLTVRMMWWGLHPSV